MIKEIYQAIIDSDYIVSKAVDSSIYSKASTKKPSLPLTEIYEHQELLLPQNIRLLTGYDLTSYDQQKPQLILPYKEYYIVILSKGQE